LEEVMKTRIGHLDKTLRKAVSVSLVVAAYTGGAALGSGPHASEQVMNQSVESVQAAAAQGDIEAMYWLAVMHIEGTIAGADYDRGVELLKTSAFRGNPDAERMYTFMDNAFSGEGC
jgi:TPR repeat protein